MASAGLRAYGTVLSCDLILWGVLWGGLVLLGWPSREGVALGWLWALGAGRWLLLHAVSVATASGRSRPVLRRWVATLCLLGPAFESGKAALQRQGSPGWSVPLPDPGVVALAAVAASSACLFWELTFPEAESGTGGGEKRQKAWALFVRVVRYSRPDALHLGAAFLFLTLAVLSEMCIPYYTGRVVDLLGSRYQHSSFLSAIGFMALFSFTSSLCAGLRGGMFMCSLSRLNRRMRHMLFHSLVQQEIGFFEETKSGSLTSRLSSDTDRMGRSVAMNMNVLVRSTVKVLGLLGLMLGLSWHLTVLTCVEMPLLALLQNFYNARAQALGQQLQDCEAEARAVAASALGAVRTVRSFGAEQAEARRYQEAVGRTRAVHTRKDTLKAVLLLLRRLVTVGVKVMMLIYGRRLIASGQLTNGGLLAFVLYQKDMATSTRQLVSICGEMLNCTGAASKVFEYLDRKPREERAGNLEPSRLEGRLTLRDVTFSYPTKPDAPALKGLSLELCPGKMTALVGPSGGGKSSCVGLLERFYEPHEGQVLLDGLPLHCYQHRYLHNKMAMVSQDPVLFSGSVRDNIAYGLEDCSLERIERAARKANAHKFICELEQGYDTDVGECGGCLSAGQKQCIAIARALVREPQILILDEVTSCLDLDTQLAMQDVLTGSVGQTVLVVAHRLKTVEQADRIVFLEDGAVVEQGTHQQLMASRGRYYRLREKLFSDLDSAGDSLSGAG
ncbi:antigen peptide transporter 2 [Anguilla anguilla]|uniref:antigen peptide transporter 2 n=1 Tax=Anguilla anguilla TaxID=7936 RepID=UPI0015ABBE2E|nr:antigen peptide transporter 2 [Anguilla anguilla]XP_035261872.1 antigen peptide transporter 2 [Anguilla anguilla]